MSMEEEQARQAALNQASSSSAPQPTTAAPATEPAEPVDEEDNPLLKAVPEGNDVEMGAQDEDEDLSEEEAIAQAIAMSMKESQGEQDKDKK